MTAVIPEIYLFLLILILIFQLSFQNNIGHKLLVKQGWSEAWSPPPNNISFNNISLFLSFQNNIGHKLLVKQGWSEGQGLGKQLQGIASLTIYTVSPTIPGPIEGRGVEGKL